ncbi:MAG TPA: DUF4058 family protein [Gemmataceae bacterium]|nr:DUF4058 family protein [Gemmataceae bacterium]
MPSPFPGMNPYLEREGIWKDFHDSFLMTIRNRLVPQVMPNYIVKLGEYLFIHEPSAEPRLLVGHGDVSLSRTNGIQPEPVETVGLLTPTKIRIPFVDLEEHVFLEIRDRENLDLVTVIEMLSPSNKKPGADRDQYLAKRALLLRSEAHFVELDLLRGWARMPAEPEQDCDYCVMVSRVESRPEASFWSIGLRSSLPTIPIPLRGENAAVRLDLQAILNETYDQAGYQYHLYRGSPNPRLRPDDAAWAATILAANK